MESTKICDAKTLETSRMGMKTKGLLFVVQRFICNKLTNFSGENTAKSDDYLKRILQVRLS